MNNKKRLYEVFSKVTGVPINEQEGMSQEQWDDLQDSIEYGIRDHFKDQRSIFNDGIPQTLRATIMDLGELEMTLLDNNGIQFVNSIEDQIQYVANYQSSVNNTPIVVRMPFTVFVEKDFSGDGVKFYSKTTFTPMGMDGINDIEVEIGK